MKTAVCLSVQEIAMSLARVRVMPVVLVLLIKNTIVWNVIIHVVKLVRGNVPAVQEVALRLAKVTAQVHVMILVRSVVQAIVLLHVLGRVFIHV